MTVVAAMPEIPTPRARYPRRRGRRGHGPDCPYWSTHRAHACPCCRGEAKGDRAEQARAGRPPARYAGVPAGAPTPVDLAPAARPAELVACPTCFAPTVAGTPCRRCQPTT